uniref:Protein kinase domain-containing protein n=1 Tax=Macrostomum lignano TaxID=282301 RepID=A0A1I8IZZ5_9PLAT
EASLLLFDKKIADKLHKPKRKETVSEILRREVRYLERFKHPKLLQIWHPAEDCSDSLGFATEPIWGSLANFLGKCDRISSSVPAEIKESLTDLEIKHGIFQKVIHGNVSPCSILITKRGCWKLSGLGFVEKSSTLHLPKMAQPDLDYLAPDLQIYGKATQACDIFSLGLAIFNGGVSLLDAGRSSQQYHRKVEELPVNLPKALTQLPCELAELVEKMLDREPRHRPSAQLLSMNKYFQDPLLLALEGLVTCEAKTVEQKKEFFSLLMQTMMREQFPK